MGKREIQVGQTYVRKEVDGTYSIIKPIQLADNNKIRCERLDFTMTDEEVLYVEYYKKNYCYHYLEQALPSNYGIYFDYIMSRVNRIGDSIVPLVRSRQGKRKRVKEYNGSGKFYVSVLQTDELALYQQTDDGEAYWILHIPTDIRNSKYLSTDSDISMQVEGKYWSISEEEYSNCLNEVYSDARSLVDFIERKLSKKETSKD